MDHILSELSTMTHLSWVALQYLDIYSLFTCLWLIYPVIYLGPDYGGGNEDNGDLLQKVPCTHCCTQGPQPCSRPPLTHVRRRLLDPDGQVWVSLLWGHCSLLLDLGVHKVLFVPSKCLFPQSCISSGDSTVGLMVTSFKRAYAISRSAAPKAPAPVAVHC